MIDRNIANKAIATPIKGVVPQPGATFPYSEFKGFSKLPDPTSKATDWAALPFGVLVRRILLRDENLP